MVDILKKNASVISYHDSPGGMNCVSGLCSFDGDRFEVTVQKRSKCSDEIRRITSTQAIGNIERAYLAPELVYAQTAYAFAAKPFRYLLHV